MSEIPTLDELAALLRYAGAAFGALLVIGLGLGKTRLAGPLGGVALAASLGWLWIDHNGGALPPVPLLQESDRVLTSTERGLLAIFAAAIAECLAAWLPATARWAPRLAVAAILCGWMLETPAAAWEGTDAAWWLFGLAGALLLWQDLLGRVATARPGPDVLIVLSLAAGLLAQSCIGYGSAKLAETSGTLAMILGGSALLAPWFGSVVLAPAFLAVAATGLFAVGLDAWFFGADPVIPWRALALLGTAPLLLCVGRFRPLVTSQPALSRGLAVVLALAALAGGFWIAADGIPEPAEDDPYADLYKPR